MIFEDTSQNRWKITLLVFISTVIVGLVIVGVSIASIIVNPPLPNIAQKSENRAMAEKISAKIAASDIKNSINNNSASKFFSTRNKNTNINTNPVIINTLLNSSTVSLAFLQQYEDYSIDSFKEHASSLDAVIPDWYFVTSSTCAVDERADQDITDIIQSKHVAIIPRVTNGDRDKWHVRELETLLHSYNDSSCLSDTLATLALKAKVAGLNIDFEGLNVADRDAYSDFLSQLANKLHSQKQLLTVDVPARDPAFDLEYIGSVADAVVVMSYDEHFAAGQPGPIASQGWFDDTLDEVTAAIPKEKVIVAFGQYAYDWTAGTSTPASSLTFSETMSLVNDVGADPELEQNSRNMFFGYVDDKNKEHHVWFLNGVTAWNEILETRVKKVKGIALWRLGSEDPSVWNFFSHPEATGQSVTKVPELQTIEYLSEGELFKISTLPQEGAMDVTFDDDGSVDSASYSKIPSGYTLERVGDDIPKKTLVLSFDDGPDPVWTPQILKVLSDNQVPAIFFIVGDQAQKYPDLLNQMAKNNLLVGNHTYLHPDISTISPARLRLEVNSTQRVIESAYGRKTILFRAPYNTDANPESADQLKGLDTVTKLGYIIVGANIDSNDWQKPGVDKIVQNVEEQVSNPLNHIIVMHDAGGDRSETVAALKIIIPELKKRGYTFASLDKAARIPRDMMLPNLDGREYMFVKITGLVSWLRRWGWLTIVWLFYFTTGLAIIRISFLGYNVLKSERLSIQNSSTLKSNFNQFVSVIIPAYNEEKTIKKTLLSILNNSYKNLEILVINDGSIDQTAAIVEKIAQEESRVRLFSQPNKGKAVALNTGLNLAKGEVVVTIDGDTILFPETIHELVKAFANPEVDAVCGNVEVGNVHNILTAFQALEYITTQNFDRRAFDVLNCISVVPGATGAWRKEKILALGGYENDTLTEDADLTLKLLRSGGKIVYAPKARSITEAPETLKNLAKQRFRWSYGTYQCLYKHREAFFHGTLGWIALPNMFFFQILFPILSPIGDLVFILSIIRGDLYAILAGYLLFLLMDVCGSLLAFTLEKKPKKLMWVILIQRFFYRQFMYIIAYRSIVAILQGKRHGWNKISRVGTIKMETKV